MVSSEKNNDKGKESIKQALIDALKYPRELGKCIACPQQSECEWLYHNEGFAALEKKPISEILTALEIASDYVAAQVTYWEHDSQRCGCTSCSWLRDALRLVDQAHAR
jgi:hypothetical protein